jgi:hypothetical protein
MERAYGLLLESEGGCGKMTFDYKSMLERIRQCEWAKKWRGIDTPPYEEEEMIDDFFSLPLKEIVGVLPEILQDMKENVRDEVECLLDSIDAIVESNYSRFGRGYFRVDFDLDKYLNDICKKVSEVARNE